MKTSLSSKRSCSHRFVDQYSSKCLHCGSMKSSLSCPPSQIDDEPSIIDDQDGSLELEHYERLVLMLDEWKKNMVTRIESIYKSKSQRLRDEFERQQIERRRRSTIHPKKEDSSEEEKIIDLKNFHFQLIHSAAIDTEYTLMAASSETIFFHDGRVFKLFDKDLRPLVALDLSQSMRERCKVVDLCYVSYLSSYLILYEQCLWVFKPGSNANLVPSVKRRGYMALSSNNKDLFILDTDGTIEQRSLVSWTYLRRYSRQHMLNDCLNDQILSIRFHTVDLTRLMAVIRTTNNRRCLMIYQHYGSNTFKLLDRVLFPNVNVYTIAPLHLSHVWILTTCEKQTFFFLDHMRQYHQRDQQQVCFALDCDYRIKNALPFTSTPRSLLVRTIRPSHIRLYHF